MKDPFDYQKYMTEMNQFISRMCEVDEERDPRIAEYVKPLAELLHLGRMELAFYEHPSKEIYAPNQVLLLYNMNNYDSDHVLFYRDVLLNGNVVHYIIYQISGENLFDEEERERVLGFKKLLNRFIERYVLRGVIEYFMYHDSPLNMHNLRYFIVKVGELSNQGSLGQYTVCHFNLKQFSLVNEFVGREQGTQIMKDFIKAYKERFLVPGEEYVCRVGGDNFITIFRKEKLEEVLKFMSGVSITANTPNHDVLTITASVGVYELPDEKLLPTDVIERVTVANKVAKNDRRTSVAYFDEQMFYVENNAKKVQSMFPEALQNGEFYVYYQPKVNLEDYRLSGAEALCRWIHEGELITPDKFIPIFERKGLIGQLDFFMQEHVCLDIRRWLDEGKDVVTVSVNLSRCHFEDKKLFEHIMEIIDKYEIPHELLEIELTETTTDVDFSELRDITGDLHYGGRFRRGLFFPESDPRAPMGRDQAG